jgi:hypothetical protein
VESGPEGASRESRAEERSGPLAFFWADLALAFLGVERWDFSSSASSASRSAFLRAASARLAAVSSLEGEGVSGLADS